MLVVSRRGLGAGCQGHVGGAGAVSVDDGRQPLHVGAEHLGHGLLFGVAQLGKFLGDMGHRAVMLADLHTVNRSADPRGGGDVARLGQRAGDPLGGRLDVGVRRAVGGGNIGQDGVDPLPGERLNRVLTADFAQLPHGRRRQVVVGVVELGPAGRGQPVALGGPPASHLLPGRSGRGLGVARLDQRVEMTPHAGGRQAQPVTDFAGGDRSGLHQQAHDGAAGLPVGHRAGQQPARAAAAGAETAGIFTTPV